MEETYFWDWPPLHVILAADIPPSPGNIPTTHPLMVRHADHSSLTLGSGSSTTRLTQGIGRSQRTLRQLTANTGHTIHVHYPGNRQPNPPLILQRWVRSRIYWTQWSSWILTELQHCLGQRDKQSLTNKVRVLHVQSLGKEYQAFITLLKSIAQPPCDGIHLLSQHSESLSKITRLRPALATVYIIRPASISSNNLI